MALQGLTSCIGEGYIVQNGQKRFQDAFDQFVESGAAAAFRSLETSSVNIGERFESCPLRSTKF